MSSNLPPALNTIHIPLTSCSVHICACAPASRRQPDHRFFQVIDATMEGLTDRRDRPTDRPTDRRPQQLGRTIHDVRSALSVLRVQARRGELWLESLRSRSIWKETSRRQLLRTAVIILFSSQFPLPKTTIRSSKPMRRPAVSFNQKGIFLWDKTSTDSFLV